jgi:hypothetical protein
MPVLQICRELFYWLAMKNKEINLSPERAPIYWTHEAIIYLGLDRLGLARPDKAIYRLIRKGALHPKKISGHFAFDKIELDMVATQGDEKWRRGRPRKYHSA